ncbi:hypothetical protein ACIRON_08955 [Nocardioides sp. NPDC101246]|uniref:hypothetical protein n=1 Tax=Nocardioides sp. NPDC101246 TaxID=3364336 RepID=UPI00382452A3
MSIHDDWWDYVRRVGDDIGVKKFDVEVTPDGLDALIAEPLTEDRLDDLIGHMGRAFKPEMTRRSAFTSELFPMLPYMCLSTIEDYHTYGSRVRTIREAKAPEEIARGLSQRCGQASPLWTWMAGYHYLCGREALSELGGTTPGDRADEVRDVVDFWRRLTLAQRGDGTMDNKDAGFTDRYLPEDEVAWLLTATQPLADDSRKALKQLNATVSGFSFLSFTDSRVGIYDSGPYDAGDGTVAIVRDYLCLDQNGVFGYPWMDGIEAPYSALTLVLRYDPSVFTEFEINDWGTTFTEPDQLMSLLSHATVIGHAADGGRKVLAPEEWAGVTSAIARSHMVLYERFAAMSREERVLAATTMYSWGLKPFAAAAGVLDDIDWEISPATRALYPDPLDNDDKAAAAFGTPIVATPNPGSFRPVR